PAKPEVTMRRGGTLGSLTLPPGDDALVSGFAIACKARGRPMPARLDFEVSSEIPTSRGLGSSSAALVAGALLADATLSLGFDRYQIAELCSDQEGHPDNIAPAALGGAVLGVRAAKAGGETRRWILIPIAVHPSLAFAFAIPGVLVETHAARAMLPGVVSRSVAVTAAGKAAALAHGLVTGDSGLLRVALDDVLHVPYRRHLVPGYAQVVKAACEAGAFGATLSGSGSAMV